MRYSVLFIIYQRQKFCKIHSLPFVKGYYHAFYRLARGCFQLLMLVVFIDYRDPDLPGGPAACVRMVFNGHFPVRVAKKLHDMIKIIQSAVKHGLI